jgi:GTP-binding protein
MDPDQKEKVKKDLTYRLAFVDFAKVHFISALHGSNVGNLFDSVQKAYQSATKELSTSKLTRILEVAVTQHPPPMVRSRRIKLRYAHTGGHKPPIIVVHGNQTDEVPEAYRRYLMNVFRKRLGLEGTPIRIDFKTSDNPFAGRRNTLTPRQEYKRKRLKKIHKKKYQ